MTVKKKSVRKCTSSKRAATKTKTKRKSRLSIGKMEAIW